MVVQAFVDDAHILVKSEDGASQEERLGDVVEQSGGHVVDVNHLIGHQRDAAHDEQYRAGVLRDFEAFVLHRSLHESCLACCAKDGGDDVTDDLEDSLYCFVHNSCVFFRVNNSVNFVVGATSLLAYKGTKKM